MLIDVANLPPPIQAPEQALRVQNLLIEISKDSLGEEFDSSKIGPPVFGENGPWADGEANNIKVSKNAKYDWYSFVFDVSHELVHFYDYVPYGKATFLEEGLAVASQLHAVCMSDSEYKDIYSHESKYIVALDSIRILGNWKEVGKTVFQKYHSFSNVGVGELKILFPTADLVNLQQLAKKWCDC